MKPVLLFILPGCPHCARALSIMAELQASDPALAACVPTVIDESSQAELAASYDYYYVPTYYVDGKKRHEGAATLEKIRRVFDAALGNE